MPAFPFYRFRRPARRRPAPAGWGEALRLALTQGLAPHELALALAAMSRLLRADPAGFLQRFGETLGHAVLGWAAVSAVAAPLIYAGARALLRLSERRPRPAPARA